MSRITSLYSQKDKESTCELERLLWDPIYIFLQRALIKRLYNRAMIEYIRNFFFGRVVVVKNQGLYNLRKFQNQQFTTNCCKL